MDAGAEAGRRWTDAVTVLGGDRRVAQASGGELARRYAESHRRYHTGEHVVAVLGDSCWLASRTGLAAADLPVLTLAVCAHDVVYQAQPGADERASAGWAREQLLSAGVAEGIARRVCCLVTDTLQHAPASGDPAAAALLDADLAILGTDRDGYDRYVSSVRAEFSAVAEPDWRVGRSRVLSGLAERRPLYLTVPGRHRWESAARRNLARELAGLAPTS